MLTTSLESITQSLTEFAPRIVELSLNPGASEEELESLEEIIGKKLPEDFKELYKTHNGINDEENFGNFFYGFQFSPIDNIIAESEFRAKQSKDIALIPLKSFDPQIDGSNTYNPGWISIGNDGARCNIFVDLAPSSQGTYGQVIFVDGTYQTGILIANSVTDLIENFAADLKNNLYTLEPDALEDEQHFLETDPSIDLLNWYTVDKWKHLFIK